MKVFSFLAYKNNEKKQGGSFRMMKAEELVLFSTRYSSSRGAALAQARNDQTFSPFLLGNNLDLLGFCHSYRRPLPILI